MASGKTTFPSRRAAAERNRDKILSAARDAFADPAAEVSMAEVARRAGVGMATLYRNFPGRRELLEALYADEVDALCAAAVTDGGQPAGTALITWLRRQFAFIPSKRQIVAELLKHAGPGDPAIPSQRARALAAGRPLLTAAQNAGEIRDDLSLEQIFDLIVAIATIDGPPEYLEPVIETMLDGVCRTGSQDTAGAATRAERPAGAHCAPPPEGGSGPSRGDDVRVTRAGRRPRR